MPDDDQASSSTEADRAIQAARSAVFRAQSSAAARGFRPGLRPRKRVPPVELQAADQDPREPQDVARELERLVTERGWQVDVAVGAVIGRWTQVVGADVAAHCRPKKFQDGRLEVQADSTAWATQFRLLIPHLMRRLGEELGETVVREVIVRGPTTPSWRRGRRTVVGPGPRDTYG